jgi:hypothetical protein
MEKGDQQPAVSDYWGVLLTIPLIPQTSANRTKSATPCTFIFTITRALSVALRIVAEIERTAPALAGELTHARG